MSFDIRFFENFNGFLLFKFEIEVRVFIEKVLEMKTGELYPLTEEY